MHPTEIQPTSILRVWTVRPNHAFNWTRALIFERQREGIAIAKAQGVYKSRKKSLKPERPRS